jgi:hypothetical protein
VDGNCAWGSERDCRLFSPRRLALICIPMMLFLSLFQWGYAYGSDGYRQVWGGVRQNVGFLAFALALATFAASARILAVKRRRTDASSCVATANTPLR